MNTLLCTLHTFGCLIMSSYGAWWLRSFLIAIDSNTLCGSTQAVDIMSCSTVRFALPNGSAGYLSKFSQQLLFFTGRNWSSRFVLRDIRTRYAQSTREWQLLVGLKTSHSLWRLFHTVATACSGNLQLASIPWSNPQSATISTLFAVVMRLLSFYPKQFATNSSVLEKTENISESKPCQEAASSFRTPWPIQLPPPLLLLLLPYAFAQCTRWSEHRAALVRTSA